MFENLDELIDKNLKMIYDSNDKKVPVFNLLSLRGRRFSVQSESLRFANEMKTRDLISINGDFVSLSS